MTNLNINSVVYVCVSFLNAQESRQYPRIRVVVIQWSLLFHSLYTNIKIIRKHEIISRTLISVKVFGLQSLIMIASGFYGDFWRFQGIKWKRHKSPSPKIIVSSSLVNVCFIRTGRFFFIIFIVFRHFSIMYRCIADYPSTLKLILKQHIYQSQEGHNLIYSKKFNQNGIIKNI